MKTFFVWHLIDTHFNDNTAETLNAFPAGFRLVAKVETDDVSRVFQLTNHIEEPWWSNRGVTKLVENGVRSTSVGDVIVQLDAALTSESGLVDETIDVSITGARYSVDGIGLRGF